MLAALFLAATPYFIVQGGSEVADAPLSFFILATMALITLQDRAWPRQRGLSVLAGMCMGMAAWTKNEGLLLVAVVMPIRAMVMWRWYGGRAAGQQAAWLAGGLTPVLAVVLLFKFTLATSNANLGGRPGDALLSLLMDPRRWQVMVVQLVRSIVRFGDLPVGVPLVLTAFLALVGVDRKADSISQLTVLAALSLLLAGYCVVCVVSPYDILWQTSTALRRLLLQLWPAAVFLAFLAAKRIAAGQTT
jgi:4-amino-4-deoxy-L-arabinose transferase-like glycosyltransferase